MNKNKQEWLLLVEACQAALPSSKNLTPISKLEGINYAVLLKLASYHKVIPLFYKGISKHPKKATIPVSFLMTLRKQSLNFAVRNLKNAKEFLRLQALFKASNIEVIPYKGTVLADMAYNELGIRQSSDIDILAKKKDLDAIYTILEKEGYKPSYKMSSFSYRILLKFYCEYNYDLYDKETRLFHVEPHWVLGKKMYQTAIDYEAIISLTKEGELLGSTINKLTPEGLLVTTIVHHGSAEAWSRLKNILDIAAILNQFEKEIDWELVFSICVELKVINILALGLSIAKELFNAPLPKKVVKLLNQKNIKQLTVKRKADLAQVKIQSSNISVLNRIFYQFKLRASWTTKFKVLYYHCLHVFLRPFLSDRTL